MNNRYVDVIRIILIKRTEYVKIKNRHLKGVQKLCVC